MKTRKQRKLAEKREKIREALKFVQWIGELLTRAKKTRMLRNRNERKLATEKEKGEAARTLKLRARKERKLAEKKEKRGTTRTVKFRTRKARKRAEKRERKRQTIRLFVELNQEFFTVILVTYLLLLLLEEIKEGFVSNFLNLNVVLGIALISGIITVFGGKDNEKKVEHITTKDYQWIFALGALGAALIFFKTINLGYLSFLISAVSGILIVLLSILILEDDSSNNEKIKNPSKEELF